MNGLKVSRIKIETEKVGYSCHLCSDNDHPGEPMAIQSPSDPSKADFYSLPWHPTTRVADAGIQEPARKFEYSAFHWE